MKIVNALQSLQENGSFLLVFFFLSLKGIKIFSSFNLPLFSVVSLFFCIRSLRSLCLRIFIFLKLNIYISLNGYSLKCLRKKKIKKIRVTPEGKKSQNVTKTEQIIIKEKKFIPENKIDLLNGQIEKIMFNLTSVRVSFLSLNWFDRKANAIF